MLYFCYVMLTLTFSVFLVFHSAPNLFHVLSNLISQTKRTLHNVMIVQSSYYINNTDNLSGSKSDLSGQYSAIFEDLRIVLNMKSGFGFYL